MVAQNSGRALPAPPSVRSEAAASSSADEQVPRILLVAQPGESRRCYEEAIHRTGAKVDTVAAIDTFYEAVTHFAYNGLVVDIPTKIRAMSDHKDLVYNILDRFPVIQVNRDRRSGCVRALLHGHHERTGPLELLIREACWYSPPRKLRMEERKPLHYNVLLSTTPHFDPGTLIRTVTMDVSHNGCFLFSTGRFQVGGRIWIRIMDLYDKAPIRCVIRNKRKWGQAMVIPGIGVEFDIISEDQRRALLNPDKGAATGPLPTDDQVIGAP